VELKTSSSEDAAVKLLRNVEDEDNSPRAERFSVEALMEGYIIEAR